MPVEQVESEFRAAQAAQPPLARASRRLTNIVERQSPWKNTPNLDRYTASRQIVRPAAEVEVREMPPDGAEFLAALARGTPLAEATESAQNAYPTFDLEAHLRGLIESGVLTGYSITPDGRETVQALWNEGPEP